MGILFLVKGLLVGLALAAPLGPIGMLCVNRTLAEGRRIGFCCGLGAAAAVGIYALAGAAALAAIGLWIIDDPTVLRVIGALFLVYQGARTFMRPIIVLPPLVKAPLRRAGAKAAFLATFRLTLAYPITLLAFAAMFAGLGVATVGQLSAANRAAGALVLGVFLGSVLWWLVMSSLIGRVRTHLGTTALTLINRLCGTILTAFGLYALATLLPVL